MSLPTKKFPGPARRRVFMSGLDKPLTPEQRALAEQWIPLGLKFANKWEKVFHLEEKELTAAAWEGLCRAAHGYKPELGFQFSTYAYYVLEDHLRKAASRFKSDEDARRAKPLSEATDKPTFDREPKLDYGRPKWMLKLDERELAILNCRANGGTLTDCADASGVSRERARQILVEMRKKVKDCEAA